MQHSPIIEFTEAASFEPFGGESGVSVATTSRQPAPTFW
jgi:hypothetical protein